MGKIRTRLIGDTDVENKQKKDAKERAARKKEQDAKAQKDIVRDDVEVTVEKNTDGEEKKVVKKSGKKLNKKSEREPKKRGKKYLESKNKVGDIKKHSLKATISLLKKLTYTSFDESIELHLNVLETGLRGEVSLPNGTGRSIRVAIVDDAILAKIEKGVIDFDILIAHPSSMGKLAKYAKILGPKGLMPNPKSGTIGLEPEKLAEKFKKGSVRWKTEPKFPLIHQMIGKISLKDDQIYENAKSFIESVGTKNITKAFIKNTMSVAIEIDLQNL